MPESNVDDVRARFGATAERVAEHAAQQIETVREQVRVVRRADGRRACARRRHGRRHARARAGAARPGGRRRRPRSRAARARSRGRAGERHVRRRRRDEAAVRRRARSTSPARGARCTTSRGRSSASRSSRASPQPGGRVFVDDQIAPVDPLAAFDLDRFERARDPSHTRTLPDVDLRQLFEANGLVLLRTQLPDAPARARLLPRPRRAAKATHGSARAQLSPGGPRGLRGRERLVPPAQAGLDQSLR